MQSDICNPVEESDMVDMADPGLMDFNDSSSESDSLISEKSIYSSSVEGFCRFGQWSVTDWRRVIFSDESRFSLSADHRKRVWRRTGQRSDPAFIVERHTAISQGVTVWESNFLGHTNLYVVLQGTLTARRYVDDILIVLPMLKSPPVPFIQDNARPHTARLSQQCLQGYDVLPWPARSPDLSPINVWEGNSRYRRIVCADAKTMAGSTGGHKKIIECHAEFRLV
ncbi:transposable element Tc1 transposase [Trichonephila clavipes]|nr:transposable element Tc1 transposase [Trichonephila clavipes]